jgi:CubicO group peptidase (beta-lactamase class C family)
MTTNQLADELMPYSLPTSPPFFNQGFGFGLAVQLETHECSWGGAASTNWYVNPELGTVFVGMTQRMPVLGVFGRIKPPMYTSIEQFQD